MLSQTPPRNVWNKIICAKRVIGSFAATRDALLLEKSILRVRYLPTRGASLNDLACEKHRNNYEILARCTVCAAS